MVGVMETDKLMVLVLDTDGVTVGERVRVCVPVGVGDREALSEMEPVKDRVGVWDPVRECVDVKLDEVLMMGVTETVLDTVDVTDAMWKEGDTVPVPLAVGETEEEGVGVGAATPNAVRFTSNRTAELAGAAMCRSQARTLRPGARGAPVMLIPKYSAATAGRVMDVDAYVYIRSVPVGRLYRSSSTPFRKHRTPWTAFTNISRSASSVAASYTYRL